MIPRPFDQINKSDLDALVTNSVREGRSIEYKEQLPTGKVEDKKSSVRSIVAPF
jgi:hypothetical protein